LYWHTGWYRTQHYIENVEMVMYSHREDGSGDEGGLSRLLSARVILPSVLVPLAVLVCCLVACVRHHRQWKRHLHHHHSPSLSYPGLGVGAKQPRHPNACKSLTIRLRYLLAVCTPADLNRRTAESTRQTGARAAASTRIIE